mmetsp:Transcript_11297/g.24842  ORF Transcript_11297/g.24842 Transcript_11297/m.24842 type:complete len:148 (-) Transcript_11297:97-540(-)
MPLFKILLLGGLVVGIKPRDGIMDGINESCFVLLGDSGLELHFRGVGPEREAVDLQIILRLDAVLDDVILGLVLFGLVDHVLNLILRQTTLVDGDGDLLSSGLLQARHIEDTVVINIKADIDLRVVAIKVELSKKVVAMRHDLLSFK